MFRTFIIFLYLLVYLPYSYIDLIRVRSLLKQNKTERADAIIDRKAKYWASKLVRLSGSKVQVIGEERIPEGAVLFVCNHQSMYDILLMYGFIQKPKAFISKKEVAKAPIIGKWMKYIHCIFMDRKDVRQSLRAINQGAGYLKEGYSLVIFPEGTRNPEGRLQEFKTGSFKLASKSGVPVVPIAIEGSSKILGQAGLRIRSANVKIQVGDPVTSDHPAYSDTNQLSGLLHERIAELLNQKRDVQ